MKNALVVFVCGIFIFATGCIFEGKVSSYAINTKYIGKYKLDFIQTGSGSIFTRHYSYSYSISKKNIFGKYKPLDLSSRNYESESDSTICYIKFFRGEKGKMVVDRCRDTIIKTKDVDNVKYVPN